MYVCMYERMYVCPDVTLHIFPLDLPISINEVSIESYQCSGCHMLYIVQK